MRSGPRPFVTQVTGYGPGMRFRLLAGTAALAVAVTGTIVPATSTDGAPAPKPGPRGAKSTWTQADKTGFGTARSTRSNVWFTLQGGRVSEVFYPDLSTPSVRSLELVVTGDPSCRQNVCHNCAVVSFHCLLFGRCRATTAS